MQLHVIHFGESLRIHLAAHPPGKVGQGLQIGELDVGAVLFHEEKPVTAPSDVTAHPAASGHVDRDVAGLAVARNVVDRHLTIGVQLRLDCTDRRVDPHLARREPAEVRERGHEADRAVPAHAEAAHVVEKDHADVAPGAVRRHEQRTHHHIRAARLVDHCGPEPVVLAPKPLHPLRQRSAPEVGPAAEDQPRGFARGVGIEDVDGSRGVRRHHGAER